MIDYFKKIDIFSPDYAIEQNNSSKHKTIQGSSISFLLFVFGGVLTFIFGVDIWERKKPLATQSIIVNPVSKINTYRFPLIFSVTDLKGKNLDPDLYFDYYIVMFMGPFTKNDTDINYYVYDNKASLYKCSLSEEFDVFKGKEDYFQGNHFLCPSFVKEENSFIQNEKLASNSTTFTFVFNKCNNKIRKCAENIDIMYDEISLYFTYYEKLVDISQYNNFIQSSEKNLEIQVSSKLQKSVDILFDSSEILTDQGWFFEDIVKNQFLMTYSYSTKYLYIEENSNNPNIIINLGVSQKITQIKRSYLKIQELFARIGGIMNVFLVILNLISKTYLRYIYLLDLSVIMYDELLSNNQLLLESYLNKSELPVKKNNLELNSVADQNLNLKENEANNLSDKNFKEIEELEKEIDKPFNSLKNNFNKSKKSQNSIQNNKNELLEKIKEFGTKNLVDKKEKFEELFAKHKIDLESSENWFNFNYFRYLCCNKNGTGKNLNLIFEISLKPMNIKEHFKTYLK